MVHLQQHQIGAVGTALSAHTLGMFPLSPLADGCSIKSAPAPVMLTACSPSRPSAALAATAPHNQALPRVVALFRFGVRVESLLRRR